MSPSAPNVDRSPVASHHRSIPGDSGRIRPAVARLPGAARAAGVDADDLVQEVFVRVIRSLTSLRRTERPEAWLFQIARNALRDSLRARLRREGRTDALEVDPPAEPDAAADRAAEAELAPCLTAMVGRLAEPYRTAIRLHVTAGSHAGRRGSPGRDLDLRHEVPGAAWAGPTAPDAGDVLRHRGGRARRRLGLSPARTSGVRRAGADRDHRHVRLGAMRAGRGAGCVHREGRPSSGVRPATERGPLLRKSPCRVTSPRAHSPERPCLRRLRPAAAAARRRGR